MQSREPTVDTNAAEVPGDSWKTYLSKLSEHHFHLVRWYAKHSSIFVHEGEPVLDSAPLRSIGSSRGGVGKLNKRYS